MEKQKTLSQFMQPVGGMAGLRVMFEGVGLKLNRQAVHAFNRQAIPAKYTAYVLLIKNKFGVDLSPFVRMKDERLQPQNAQEKCLYPLTLEKLKSFGLGSVASEMNQDRNKKELFPTNPPKRFNHHSLAKLLTKKLTDAQREYFANAWNLESEILADEKAAESGLLG